MKTIGGKVRGSETVQAMLERVLPEYGLDARAVAGWTVERLIDHLEHVDRSCRGWPGEPKAAQS